MASALQLIGMNVPKGLESPMKERKVIRIIDIVKKENKIMEKYISLNALVAEIKTRIETYNKGYANGDDCRADALETFLHDIDTLEVKEVDLEKEIDKELAEEWYGEYIDLEKFKRTAKHFYELGLKAQKGE